MNLDKLVHYINARELARLNKENKNIDVSLDPIVRDYFFTNVNKWDDRQSKIFLKRIEQGDPYMESLIFPIVHKDQYESLPLDRKEMIKMLERGEVRKQNAYFLGANKWVDQQKIVANFLQHHKTFTPFLVGHIPGYGDFLTNQVMSNLRKVSGFVLYHKQFLAGNGTKLGYKFLTGEKYKDKRDIITLRDELLKRDDISDYVKDCITKDLNNVGNILCEFSKYCKIERMVNGGPKCNFRNYKS